MTPELSQPDDDPGERLRREVYAEGPLRAAPTDYELIRSGSGKNPPNGQPSRGGRYATPPAPPALVTRTAADITEEAVDWLWPGRVPLGMVTILDGDPGLGKSLITLAMAAAVTRGLPIAPGAPPLGPADVLILAAEDDAARTIIPRLRAAGADLGRVQIVDGVPTGNGDRPLRFPEDLQKLRDEITKHKARLVLIDPIMGFLDGQVDSHKDQSSRSVLAVIKQVAEETGAAVVMIRHLNKKAGESAMYRGGGSIAFTAAARSALVVGHVPGQPDTYALAVVKCNLAPPTPAITYGIDSPGGVPVISWGQVIDLSADDLLPAAPPGRGVKLIAAKAWLTDQLGKDPVLFNDLLARAKEAGHAEKTLRRAADELGVDKSKEHFSGRWFWSLPSKMANSSSQESDLAIFGRTSEKRIDSLEDGQTHPPRSGVGHRGVDGPDADRIVEGEL